MMERARLDDLATVYHDGLLHDVLPFWTRHAVDRECGGFTFALDRDGSVLDTDKGIWQHRRFTWLLATLHAELEPREEWYALAGHGIAFLRAHAFDADGRMFFQVTREGRPLRKRRYVFSECFGAMAFAAWARISGDAQAADQARALFRIAVAAWRTPGSLAPKVDPGTRPMKSLGLPMILVDVGRVMRETLADPLAEEVVAEAIAEIRRDFVKPELRAVMENVAPDGSVLDHFDGRLLNPGHALEAAWFLLAEARRRGDAVLAAEACAMVDWMWERGWDEKHGGVFCFRDLNGRPVQEYWHDMKFWWPQNEAVTATLLAWRASGEPRFARMHALAHDWAHRHLADPGFGEWFGYLHRDGRVSVPLKGSLWKGPFHLPRMQWNCLQLIEEARAGLLFAARSEP
ncbi:MAG TPA: AGE family epimerase/isomerase [Planctomycetota bacterium]